MDNIPTITRLPTPYEREQFELRRASGRKAEILTAVFIIVVVGIALLASVHR
jgi:hypothetical protein